MWFIQLSFVYNIKMQPEEVIDVKYVTLEEMISLVKLGEIVKSTRGRVLKYKSNIMR